MKWSQQKNTSKHNYVIGRINANHAQEGKKERNKKKKIPEEEYKQVISILNHQKQAVLAVELLSQLTLLFKCRREIY